MNDIQHLVTTVFIWAIPVIFAITLHECAHGWVANKLGDPTAKMMGRLTLNPIKHADPLGTFIVPIVVLILTKFSFAFGWAKPVPVTYQNLRNPKRDMAFVAIAGPASNLLMALFWAIITKLMTLLPMSNVTAIIYSMGIAGILINIVLMVLNLLPLPPLDGSRVVSAFLSDQLSYQYNRLERLGFIILIILLVSGVLGRVIGPVIFAVFALIANFFGIPYPLGAG